MVAEVAIVEDPRVRLTTNIIDSDPDELAIGQPVEVTFQQVDDVWLPLFTPAADADAADRDARGPDPAGAASPSTSGRC